MNNPFHLQQGLVDVFAMFLKTLCRCPLERLDIYLKLTEFWINLANLVDNFLVYPFEQVVLRLPLAFVWYNNSMSVMNCMNVLQLRNSEDTLTPILHLWKRRHRFSFVWAPKVVSFDPLHHREGMPTVLRVWERDEELEELMVRLGLVK